MPKPGMEGREPPVFTRTVMDLDNETLTRDYDGLKIRGIFLNFQDPNNNFSISVLPYVTL